MIAVQPKPTGTRPPDKLPHPSSGTRFVLQNSIPFIRYLSKNACCASIPSKSESGRCENEDFLRDILQIPTVEDAKTKRSRETSLKS